MDYTYILRRSWHITWRQRALWPFGVLAIVGMLLRPLFDGRSAMDWLPQGWQQRIGAFTYEPPYPFLIVGLVLFVLLSLAAALLNALGRAALVQQVNHVENGGRAAIRAGWHAGRCRIWRVFLVVSLLGIPVFIVMMAGFIPYISKAYAFYLPPGPTIAPAVLIETMARFLVCLFPAAFLGLLLTVPTRVLQRLAVRACVLERQSVWESIRRAWQIVRHHPAALLLFWLILAVVRSVLVLVFGPLLALLIFGGLLTRWLLSYTVAAQAVLLLAALLTGCGAALGGGILETFLSACWTLAYRDMTGLGRTGEDLDWADGGQLDTSGPPT